MPLHLLAGVHALAVAERIPRRVVVHGVARHHAGAAAQLLECGQGLGHGGERFHAVPLQRAEKQTDVAYGGERVDHAQRGGAVGIGDERAQGDGERGNVGVPVHRGYGGEYRVGAQRVGRAYAGYSVARFAARLDRGRD